MGKRWPSGLAVVGVLVAVAAASAVGVGPVSAAPAPPPAKALVVAAAPATSVWSQPVRLTASITPRGGGTPRGGTVTFLADGVPVGTATATTRVTTLTTRALPPGEHAVTAAYAGDDRTAPGTSAPTPVTVAAAPTTLRVAATPAQVLAGRPIVVKATVQAAAPGDPSRRPTGTVAFSMPCRRGDVPVNANGVATWRVTPCPGPGRKTITATYAGTDRHGASGPATGQVRIVFPTQDQGTTGDLGPDVPVERHGDVVSRHAQTFTAGRTGLLTDVGFGVDWDRDGGAAPQPLDVTVQAVDQAGIPTGTVLGRGAVVPDVHLDEDGAAYLTLALAQPAPITAGTRYALVFDTAAAPGPAHGRWHLWTTAGDVYPGPLHHGGADGSWTPAAHDLAFTTWVHTPT